MPVFTSWRGIITDPETARYLTAVAAEVTKLAAKAGVPDFNVTPIPGCGSYQTSTTASAGTHGGGGAVDINAEGLTDTQARVLESAARKWGGTAWFRPRTSPTGFVYGWQRHVHILRSDCGDLAPAAVTQVGQYRRGLNGLANNGPDTGNRSWVGVTWAAVKNIASTIGSIGAATADAATPAQEDDVSAQDVWSYKMTSPDGKVQADAAAFLTYTNAKVDAARAEFKAQLEGLTAAVQALASSQGADASSIAGIVDKAVRDRLAQVKFDVTDATP